jgi:hypothetical protein
LRGKKKNEKKQAMFGLKHALTAKSLHFRIVSDAKRSKDGTQVGDTTQGHQLAVAVNDEVVLEDKDLLSTERISFESALKSEGGT